jgi:hypothetical protein
VGQSMSSPKEGGAWLAAAGHGEGRRCMSVCNTYFEYGRILIDF